MINKKFFSVVFLSFAFLVGLSALPKLVSADATGNAVIVSSSGTMKIFVLNHNSSNPDVLATLVPATDNKISVGSSVYLYSPIVEEWDGWAKISANGIDYPVAGPGSSITINGQTFSPCTSCQNHDSLNLFHIIVPKLSIADGTDVTIKLFKALPVGPNSVTTNSDGVTSMALPENDPSKGFYTVSQTFKYYNNLTLSTSDPYILADGNATQSYNQALPAKVGSGTVIWGKLLAGSLPAGFNVNSSSVTYSPVTSYVKPAPGNYMFVMWGTIGGQDILQKFKINITGPSVSSNSSNPSSNSSSSNLPAGCTSTTNFSPLTGVPCVSNSSSSSSGSSSSSSSSSAQGVANLSGGSTSISITATPVKFENSKWTYEFSWNRVRDAQGTFIVSPKNSLSTITLKVDPAPSNTHALVNGVQREPVTAQLEPGVTYQADFYALPQCSRNDVDCIPPIASATFTTPAAGANVSSATSAGTSGGNNSSTTSSLQSQIDSLNALIKQLIDLLTSKGVNVSSLSSALGGSTGTSTSTQYPCTNSSNCPPPTAINTNGSRATYLDTNLVDVFKSNPGTGLAYPVEPQVTDVFNKANPGPTSKSMAYATDPKTGNLITNTSSADCWKGTTDLYTTCDQFSRFSKDDYQEVWVYGTVGRPWVSSFWGPQCDNANIKIEKTLNIPAGIALDNRCQADSVSGRKIVLGTMSGSPSTSGIFKNEFKVTTTKSDGTSTTGLTRVYFKIIDHGIMDVKLYPTEGNNTDTAVDTVTLASRLSVSVEQTKNITTWTDIDFWAVPGKQDVNKNPEYFTNRIQIGRYTVDEGYQGCNASTAGGVGAYKFGCARWNWLVGSTLSNNLVAGDYTIYATTHLPYVDSNGSYTARLYGNCQIGFTNTNGQGTSCNGFAWGGTHLKIDSALPGAVLPNSPTNSSGTSSVASFSQLTIKAKRTIYKADGSTSVTESSIGESGTSNSSSTGCVAGNDSGGVTCAGPITSSELKAGEKFDYEWQILVPNTKYIDARYATSSTNCNIADVVNSGGYWQGGEGKFCGDGSPIGGTVVRKGTPVPFTGTVNSSIVARGAVISTYLAPTDTQASFVRKCTADLFGLGGFDYNPSQGFINSAQGGYNSSTAKFSSKVLSPDCAAALRGVSIDQTVNVYVALNGGGSTYAGYRMGGLNFVNSCVGVLDSYLCPQSYQPISNSEAWFNRPGICNIPNTADIASRLGLGVGNYNTEIANNTNGTSATQVLKENGRDIDKGLLAQFTPYSGTSLSAGWAFDKAELTLSGAGYSKTFNLGNSQNPKWLKNVGETITSAQGEGAGKSVACYYSSLNCGPKQYVSSPEFTGLNPASSYTLTARFTCDGSNPNGGKNYREGSVFVVTSSLNVGVSYPSFSGSSSTTTEDNYFSAPSTASSCYMPRDFASKLNYSCQKNGTTATATYTLPSSWKFSSLAFFGDSDLGKLRSGCAGGTGHCAFEDWNAGAKLMQTITAGVTSSAPYYSRMIFYCDADPSIKYAAAEAQCY